MTRNTTLEAMMESLAPALMAELAKKKSSSASATTKGASTSKKQTSPTGSGKTARVKSSVGVTKSLFV